MRRYAAYLNSSYPFCSAIHSSVNHLSLCLCQQSGDISQRSNHMPTQVFHAIPIDRTQSVRTKRNNNRGSIRISACISNWESNVPSVEFAVYLFILVPFHSLFGIKQSANNQRGDERNRLIFPQGISNTHTSSRFVTFFSCFEKGLGIRIIQMLFRSFS